MCNTHDTCKKHLAYRLCLYVGPSTAIAMGLAKIISTLSIEDASGLSNFTQSLYTHTQYN